CTGTYTARSADSSAGGAGGENATVIYVGTDAGGILGIRLLPHQLPAAVPSQRRSNHNPYRTVAQAMGLDAAMLSHRSAGARLRAGWAQSTLPMAGGTAATAGSPASSSAAGPGVPLFTAHFAGPGAGGGAFATTATPTTAAAAFSAAAAPQVLSFDIRWQAHVESVASVAWVAEPAAMLSASLDGVAKVWSPDGHSLYGVLDVNEAGVRRPVGSWRFPLAPPPVAAAIAEPVAAASASAAPSAISVASAASGTLAASAASTVLIAAGRGAHAAGNAGVMPGAGNLAAEAVAAAGSIEATARSEAVMEPSETSSKSAGQAGDAAGKPIFALTHTRPDGHDCGDSESGAGTGAAGATASAATPSSPGQRKKTQSGNPMAVAAAVGAATATVSLVGDDTTGWRSMTRSVHEMTETLELAAQQRSTLSAGAWRRRRRRRWSVDRSHGRSGGGGSGGDGGEGDGSGEEDDSPRKKSAPPSFSGSSGGGKRLLPDRPGSRNRTQPSAAVPRLVALSKPPQQLPATLADWNTEANSLDRAQSLWSNNANGGCNDGGGGLDGTGGITMGASLYSQRTSCLAQSSWDGSLAAGRVPAGVAPRAALALLARQRRAAPAVLAVSRGGRLAAGNLHVHEDGTGRYDLKRAVPVVMASGPATTTEATATRGRAPFAGAARDALASGGDGFGSDSAMMRRERRLEATQTGIIRKLTHMGLL
ncbi:unnamed protein product, partial [Phaeothamnion confervicola]